MDRIAIPRNTLVILCGPAGSGKSTFAAKNFLRTQIVSSDECRALVSDDPANQGVSRHAFDLMQFIIEKRLLLGRLAVADATHLKREDRKLMRRIARDYGFNAAVIVFKTPLEICLERNAARPRVVPEEALRTQYEMLMTSLQTIRNEGFDYVFIMNEGDQESMAVEILRPARRSGERRGQG